MPETTIRIYLRHSHGQLDDMSEAFDLTQFAGQVPVIGDVILEPGVLDGLDRTDPANRRLWQVVGRIFNPRDLEDYVLLVVEERNLTAAESCLVR